LSQIGNFDLITGVFKKQQWDSSPDGSRVWGVGLGTAHRHAGSASCHVRRAHCDGPVFTVWRVI